MKYSKLCASSLSGSREEKSVKLTLLLSIDHPQVIPAGSRLINWEGLKKKKDHPLQSINLSLKVFQWMSPG